MNVSDLGLKYYTWIRFIIVLLREKSKSKSEIFLTFWLDFDSTIYWIRNLISGTTFLLESELDPIEIRRESNPFKTLIL